MGPGTGAPGRAAEFEGVIADVRAWAAQEQDVTAVGVLPERRVVLPSGLEVESGFVTPSC